MRFSLSWLFLFVACTAFAFWLYGAAYPLGGVLVWILIWGVIGGIAIRSQRNSVSVCSGLMIMAGILALPLVANSGHAVSIDGLEHVQAGDTADSVRSILGYPDDVRETSEGNQWLYSGPTWCHVTVHFGDDDKVLYVAHDH